MWQFFTLRITACSTVSWYNWKYTGARLCYSCRDQFMSLTLVQMIKCNRQSAWCWRVVSSPKQPLASSTRWARNIGKIRITKQTPLLWSDNRAQYYNDICFYIGQQNIRFHSSTTLLIHYDSLKWSSHIRTGKYSIVEVANRITTRSQACSGFTCGACKYIFLQWRG